jgi:hypothetical protein
MPGKTRGKCAVRRRSLEFMIGNLLSNVLTRKSGERPAAAAPAPVAFVEPAAATPATTPPDSAAPPAPVQEAAQREAAEREDFIRRKQYERDSAQVWLGAQQLLATLRADPAYVDPRRLERAGWKAYSQNDEDGIIDEIFRRIGVRHRSFVEFGAGDGLENNTAYLLAQGWRGLWMDGGEENARAIHHGFAPLIERGLLQFKCEFITRDNVDGLIASAGLGPEIDLLSIDVDGNDVHLWEAINCINPRVVAVEYNAKFRPPVAWTVAYNATHVWRGDDYMGASLCAFDQLARRRGYRLVGCNLAGVNAFFVRDDLAGDLFASPATAEHLYQPPRYDLIYAYRGGHGAGSLSIVQGANLAGGLGIDVSGLASTFKPEMP